MPDIQRLRCVHCHTTETPLWRTGPDGPRSLCNACGVRYKKGKLILYKDDQGNLTAVKRQDALPVHVPPPAKKSIKRNSIQTSSPPPVPSSPTSDASTKRPARKSSSDAVQPVVVAKKPRSRSRRVNAGQLPGRYVCAQFPFDSNQQPWRSPTDSPSSTPSSPAHSPRISADRSTTLTTSSVVTDDFNPLHRTPLADEDHLFTDMACLGLDASADPDNNTLLSMPADPSSAEQFSFAFSGLGRDAYLAFDAPDRVEALRALLLDQTRAIYQLYDSTVQAVYRLYEYRCQHKLEMVHGAGDRFGGVEDCKSFVRSFARIDTSGPIANGVSHSPGVGGERMCGRKVTCPTVMLPEKTLHSAAAENLRNLMDSTDLAGFAEVCLVEMLAEDIAILARRLLVGYDPKLSRRLGDRGLSPPKVIATQG